MKQPFKLIYQYSYWLITPIAVAILGKHNIVMAQGKNYLLGESLKSSNTQLYRGSQLDLISRTKKFEIAQVSVPRTLPPERQPRTIPPERQPRFPDTEPLPPLEDLLEKTPQTAPPPSQESESDITIVIEQFNLKGNTAFKDTEIQEKILAEYIGKPITFSDLLDIETKITQLYTDSGYLNSGALIPQQKIEQGIITIQIIEGKIDSSQIKVNGRLSEEYVRSRLIRGTKTPFNINELQEALQLLQLNPLIERINAELSVGQSRDRWILDVEVEQADAFNPSLFANNNRTPSVGSFQRGIQLRHNNFARGGEQFSFAYRNTDGSNDYDFDFTVPFNSLNGTVSFGYRFIDSDIIEPPFNRERFNSQTDEYAVTIRQPIILTATTKSTQELAVGLEFSRQANKTTIFNRELQESEPFPLSLGADDNGETTVIALRFFQDWTRRTRSDVLAARSQFTVGLDALDATIAEGKPDGNFFAWRGQVQWIRLLDTSSNTTLLLRSDIQLSPHDLVSLEQFSVGGSNSVRGYRQDSLLGDSGIIFSGELRVPLYRWNENQNSIALIPFTDFGTVWSDKETTTQEEDTVISVGIGVELDLNERLNARLDWGIPLIEVQDRDRTLQEDGIYFSIEYFPF